MSWCGALSKGDNTAQHALQCSNMTQLPTVQQSVFITPITQPPCTWRKLSKRHQQTWGEHSRKPPVDASKHNHVHQHAAARRQAEDSQLNKLVHDTPARKEPKTSRGLTFSSAAKATMEERCHSELSYSMCPTTDPSGASNSSRKMSTLELPVWMGSTLLVVTPSSSMPDSRVFGCSAKSTWPCHNQSQLIWSTHLI